jgi:zinc protease
MAAPAPSSALPRTPAFFTGEVDAVAFDAVVRRTAAARLYGVLLDRRLHAMLRRERGTSYAAWAAYEPRDAEYAVVTAAADALPDNHGEVTTAFVNVLAEGAGGAVAEDDLETVRSLGRDALRRPGAATAFVPNAAVNLLMGAPVLTPRQMCDQLEAVSVEDVRAVADEALASGLLMVPVGQSVGRAGFVPAPVWSSAAVKGRSFRSQDHPADRRRLVLGPDGLSLVDGRRIATVRYADCVGMLSWADGARSLFGSDAINVHVEPRLWRLPRGALQLVDAAVPADRVAHLPDRPAESLPRPTTSRAQRLLALLRPSLRPRVALWVVAAVLLVVVLVVLPRSDVSSLVNTALIGLTGGVLSVLLPRRSRRR